MTQQTPPPFLREELESMNKKAIENQLFTPDHVYLDLSLLKDYPTGAVYADAFSKGEAQFNTVQKQFLDVVANYQIRTYDTVEPYLCLLGYSDAIVDALLADPQQHAQIFLFSPSTNFFHYLIRHTIRNQNHSSPRGKYIKKSISKDQYTLEAVPVTYYINTFPLTLPLSLLEPMAKELGESFGVNIKFLNKDPHLFDQTDWTQWMEKIECFYLNSLGRFTSGDFVMKQQGNMVFSGVYIFARKRFERHIPEQMKGHDFSQQVAMLTAQIDMLCDFEWIPNGDLLLTNLASLPEDTSNQME